jgi:murein DD-endopeptidase MepM/ murein hydrolase activator NlpD
VGQYIELDTGESLTYRLRSGMSVPVSLEGIGERTATVCLDGELVELPLGHFAPTTQPQPPGDLPSVVTRAGVRLGVDVTRTFMRGTRYSTSLINLQKDARLFIQDATDPLSPPGRHTFPLPEFDWHFADNWLCRVPYGWHLGIDLNAERGHPIVSVTDGVVLAIRRFQSGRDPDDFWGTNVAVLGDDGIVYLYAHPDSLESGVQEGRRLTSGQQIGRAGKSGFESKPYAPHLHFEMFLLAHPERFRFTFALEPDLPSLATPNRYLEPETQGFAVNPYPYLVDWYLQPA